MNNFIQPMQAGSLRPMVERIYGHSSAYQWVREVIVNSIQAKATNIEFTTEWQAVEHEGVHRRIVIDNGTGIARSNMVDFISTWGGSGKTLAALTENMGVGLKSSALPWNRYGMVVLTRHTPEGGDQEHSMIWMQLDPNDPELGEYGARLFSGEEQGDPEALATAVIPLEEYEFFKVDGSEVDWTKVFPGTHDGVAVVMLGNSPADDTVQGDPSRDEAKKYGIKQFIDSRFYEFPEDVSIRILQYEDWTQARNDWPTGPEGIKQYRNAEGLRSRLDSPGTVPVLDSGSIYVPESEGIPAATLHWRLYAEPDKGGSHVAQYPLTGYLFSSHEDIVETFDLKAGGLSGSAHKYRMDRFVRVIPVRDRVAILVEPHADKPERIFPDQGRTSLLFTSGLTGGKESFSWDRWVQAWRDNVPKSITKAVDDYYAERRAASAEEGLTDEDYQRLGQRYLSWLKTRLMLVKVPHKAGTQTGPVGVTGNVKKKVGAKKVLDKKPGGPTVPRKEVTPEGEVGPYLSRKVPVGLIHVTPDALPDIPHAIRFDVASHEAVLNTESESYKRAHSAIMDSREARALKGMTQGERDAVVSAVNTAMCVVAATAITEALTEARARPTEQDEILSDTALSTCLMGIHHIEVVASGYMGKNRGRIKKISA